MSKESSYKSDKELDDLLRKIADSAEIPFSKEDWGDMKARLDELPNPSPAGWVKKNRVWVGALILGLLVSVAVWNFLPVSQEEDQVAKDLETEIVPNDSKTEKSELAEKAGANTAEDLIGTKPLTAEKGAGIIGAASNSNEYVVAIENTGLNSEVLDPGPLGNSEGKKTESKAIQSRPNPLPSLEVVAFRDGMSDFIITKSNPGDPVGSERKAYSFAGRFSLSVQAAPDLSGIEMNQVEKAGNAVGIGAAYFLSPRLSIASGVFYSFKPYSSENETHYGSADEPDWIFGECDILDIPINLRYYPVEGKLQRAFVSLGLSSYLMLKEHYELEYDSGTGNPYTKEINVSGENNHFFGVVNISAGYERKLGRQLSVQVEPYFKVPISGVGEGDISLKSTGLFVGINYYPGRWK
ncbi:hypothetical protein [Algoriphagus sp. A40]|uniref:hypothetical protein n=1 Tax=Algoriphagus sp. A40 TaxID=1945863 RepID=UPI0009877CE4|nr:hypothetical protein [Algoriphagus sp. A40]OOG76723.1 hypothetical protein B0E43_06935 [Algoriphagus sp. A40]